MITVFIDSQIANKFAKPKSEAYNKFIDWLIKPKKELHAEFPKIMLSDKLINEYIGGCRMAQSETSIGSIINKMIADKRYKKFTSQEIKDFHNEFITKKMKGRGKDKLRSNKKDWDHFPLVFFSENKIGITQDKNFGYDLVNFPKLSNGVSIYICPTKFCIPDVKKERA